MCGRIFNFMTRRDIAIFYNRVNNVICLNIRRGLRWCATAASPTAGLSWGMVQWSVMLTCPASASRCRRVSGWPRRQCRGWTRDPRRPLCISERWTWVTPMSLQLLWRSMIMNIGLSQQTSKIINPSLSVPTAQPILPNPSAKKNLGFIFDSTLSLSLNRSPPFQALVTIILQSSPYLTNYWFHQHLHHYYLSCSFTSRLL